VGDENLEGPAYPMTVERSKVREFARAVLTRDPAYSAPDAVIPPTFLTVADFWWAPRRSNPIHALGFDISRTLHGEIEYVFFEPAPRVGDELVVQTKLESLYEKAGRRGGTMRCALLLTEFRTRAGEIVAEERSLVMETAEPGRT
jgi:hypothetical protein